MDNKLKIREVSGDYAQDIPFADGSVNTIYFNSKRNAETVKHIIEVDGSKPIKDYDEKSFFADCYVSDGCKNPDSYGVICVKCGECGRTFTKDGILKEN